MRLPVAILAGISLTLAIDAAPKAAADRLAYDAREALAKLQAMDIFPGMEKEDSDFADAVSTEVECLECEDTAFFKSPAWPLRIARRVAAQRGVKPRTVAEIRRHLAETFALDDESFRHIHGIEIVSARFATGGETVDLTAQLAARVATTGLTVDCDAALLAAAEEESQFERTTGEKKTEYWKRQRQLLAAVAGAKSGEESLKITFEFESETITASVKSGERLKISQEGKVSVSKIAPAAREVRVSDAAMPAKKTPEPVEKIASPSEKPALPTRTFSVRDFKH